MPASIALRAVIAIVVAGACPDLTDDDRRTVLKLWQDAGAELGSHTYSHLDLSKEDPAAYEEDILKADQTLRPLLGGRPGGAPAGGGVATCFYDLPLARDVFGKKFHHILIDRTNAKVRARHAEQGRDEVVHVIPIDDFLGNDDIDHALVLTLGLLVKFVEPFRRYKVLIGQQFFKLIGGNGEFHDASCALIIAKARAK